MNASNARKNIFGELVIHLDRNGDPMHGPKKPVVNAPSPEETVIELRMKVHVAEAELRHAMARESMADRTKANDALAAVQKELAGVEDQLQRERLRQQGVNVAANGELPFMAVMPYTQSTNAPQRANPARKSAPQDEAAFMPVMPYTKSQVK
jgi:hypothetical protein